MATDFASPPPPAPYHRGLFVAALLLVASVFPLIWMGGLVTSHGVGLSVPDWPNSYGYNMWLFPPRLWKGGIFFEHVHRLMGTLSGFVSITLMLMAWAPANTRPKRIGWAIATLLLWLMTGVASGFAFEAARTSTLKPETLKLLPHFAVGFGSLALVATIAWRCRWREPRRWARWLTVGVFVAVCLQGMMGGLRVDLVSTNLAIMHGCFAQAFFCLAAFTALVMSKGWRDAVPRVAGGHARRLNRTTALAAVTTLVIFCQLIAGALMRHNDAGLAIPGVLAYGHLLPPTDIAGLDAANASRVWATPPLPPTTLTRIWLHFAHRVGATLVTACVLTTAAVVFQNFTIKRAAARAAVILLGLLATQVTLGVLTVYWRKPADVASLHVAVGALTLMTASILTAVLVRQTAWQTARREARLPAGHLAAV